MPSDTAGTAPTQRDRHISDIAEHGRMAWQAASGYTRRARAETAMPRFKLVIGDGLRSHADERRAIEVEVAVYVLNRMLDLGRLNSLRTADPRSGLGQHARLIDPCNNATGGVTSMNGRR